MAQTITLKEESRDLVLKVKTGTKDGKDVFSTIRLNNFDPSATNDIAMQLVDKIRTVISYAIIDVTLEKTNDIVRTEQA